MRIIRKHEIQVTCGSCKTVLGVGAADIQQDDSGHLGLYCVCAECGCAIKLSSMEIPKHFLKQETC